MSKSYHVPQRGGDSPFELCQLSKQKVKEWTQLVMHKYDTILKVKKIGSLALLWEWRRAMESGVMVQIS